MLCNRRCIDGQRSRVVHVRKEQFLGMIMEVVAAIKGLALPTCVVVPWAGRATTTDLALRALVAAVAVFGVKRR